MFTVKRRFGNELWDIRQFVQPATPGVVRLVAKLPAEKAAFIQAAWSWVVNNIKYPPGPPDKSDRHYREAFLPPATARSVTYDYWSFPAETLALGIGDCEDASILLCSILRHRLGPEEVLVTIGEFNGFGHAWVTVGGLVLETTPPPQGATGYRALPEGRPYIPLLRFNDQVVREAVPGIKIEDATGRPGRTHPAKFQRLRSFHAAVPVYLLGRR